MVVMWIRSGLLSVCMNQVRMHRLILHLGTLWLITYGPPNLVRMNVMYGLIVILGD